MQEVSKTFELRFHHKVAVIWKSPEAVLFWAQGVPTTKGKKINKTKNLDTFETPAGKLMH